ncbi:MAG: hypothetical protein ABSF63_03300 [Candidatus Bathyarchaeia archaeon]|jgi:hypothetical protein
MYCAYKVDSSEFAYAARFGFTVGVRVDYDDVVETESLFDNLMPESSTL